MTFEEKRTSIFVESVNFAIFFGKSERIELVMPSVVPSAELLSQILILRVGSVFIAKVTNVLPSPVYLQSKKSPPPEPVFVKLFTRVGVSIS